MHNLKNLTIVLALCGLIAFPATESLATDEIPDTQQQSGINFITGGVGDEETDAMEAVKGDYNLRVTSADKTGHFSGAPHITITDMQHNELLSADAGPLFYADLPTGHYIIKGSNKEQGKSQKIVITGKKIAAVRFTWKAHPTDDTTPY
ncbi:MAG: hypothetical protein SFX19_05300 [Alphaproteobacteria bacterium]|nr:hypothetical protein [Alphaproteobacteria bacterium]